MKVTFSKEAKMTLLEINNLKTFFFIGKDQYPAVDDISFSLNKGETTAIIGESGSGKSVTALSIMGLVDYPGKIIGGQVLYNGENLLNKKEKELQKIRGNEISMIYQDPMTTLNPNIKVGKQIQESLEIHNVMKGQEAKKRTLDLMESVGISDYKQRYDSLPNQFSGGMRQRLMIAMAIACKPNILIADEPTTALDVTIQAEILDLLNELKEKEGMAMILNTHDLGVVAEMADDVVVMYCGKIMEKTSNKELFSNPLNPYTQKLLECIPKIDSKRERLEIIDGYVPHPTEFPVGCRFSDRCHKVMARCKEELPVLIEVEENHWVRCFLVE